MIISGSYTPASYVKETIDAAQRQQPTASQVAETDTITISEQAHKLSQSENRQDTHFENLSNRAHNDPEFAARAARDYAYSDIMPLIKLSDHDLKTGGLGTYVATGEPVTIESLSSTRQEIDRMRSEKISLYLSEKSNGTPDAVILDKIGQLISQQPDNYLRQINWGEANA